MLTRCCGFRCAVNLRADVIGGGFPLSLVGLDVTVTTWGFLEGFFGVFFAKKLNRAFGHNGRCGSLQG